LFPTRLLSYARLLPRWTQQLDAPDAYLAKTPLGSEQRRDSDHEALAPSEKHQLGESPDFLLII
jgi:hypothetical protein